MSFNDQKFFKLDVGYSAGSGVADLYKYETDDTRAVTVASGYFPEAKNMKVNDYIYCVSADGPQMLYVTGVAPVTVADLVDATVDVPANSVGTTQLQEAAVTDAKVAAVGGTKITTGTLPAAALVPASITATQLGTLTSWVTAARIANGAVGPAKLSADFAQYIVAEGGGTATAATSTEFTITGVLATDKAYASMTAGFSQPITGVVCSAGKVTVHYAAAATTANIVAISVLRKTT